MTLPSILFVTTSSNWPLTDGKRQRTWFLIETLSKKYEVDVLLIGFPSDKKQLEESQSSIRNLNFIEIIDSKFLQPGYPNILLSIKQKTEKKSFLNQTNEVFKELNKKNNYVFVFSRYLQPLFNLSLGSELKIVCDVDDVYFETQLSRIKNEKLWISKIKLMVLFFLGYSKVKKKMRRIDLPIVVKKSDEIYFNQKNIFYVPNLPFGFYLRKSYTILSDEYINEKMNYGFIGKLSYRPNYEGLIRFINSVWTPLMNKGIDARFVIAGSGIIPEKLKLAISSSKNVNLLGFIENPQEFWCQISTLVVPVAEGGGSNIKIAEALIYGKSVILNPFSARGYENFRYEKYFKIAKNNQDWLHFLEHLENFDCEIKKIISNHASEVFDLEKWKQSLLDAVDSLK